MPMNFKKGYFTLLGKLGYAKRNIRDYSRSLFTSGRKVDELRGKVNELAAALDREKGHFERVATALAPRHIVPCGLCGVEVSETFRARVRVSSYTQSEISCREMLVCSVCMAGANYNGGIIKIIIQPSPWIFSSQQASHPGVQQADDWLLKQTRSGL